MYGKELFLTPMRLPHNDELIDEVIYILGGGDEPLSREDLIKNGYQTGDIIELEIKEKLGNENTHIQFYLQNMVCNNLIESKFFPMHGGDPYGQAQERAYKLSENGIKRLEELLKSKEIENTKVQMRSF